MHGDFLLFVRGEFVIKFRTRNCTASPQIWTMYGPLSFARWHSSNTDLSDLSVLGTEPDYFSRYYPPLGGILQILRYYCFDGNLELR